MPVGLTAVVACAEGGSEVNHSSEEDDTVGVIDGYGGPGESPPGDTQEDSGARSIDEEQDASGSGGEEEDSGASDAVAERRVLPAMTAVSRGSMLDAELYPDMDLRLEIGICGSSRGDEEVLEVSPHIQRRK